MHSTVETAAIALTDLQASKAIYPKVSSFPRLRPKRQVQLAPLLLEAKNQQLKLDVFRTFFWGDVDPDLDLQVWQTGCPVLTFA